MKRLRSAITDGTGQYQIVDLRPGIYSVTFTLTGFAAVKRDEVSVTGSGVLTVNAELRVGNVSEVLNVTAETPVVDIQSTRRQAVLDNKVINELPVARGYGSILAAIPTLQGSVAELLVVGQPRVLHGARRTGQRRPRDAGRLVGRRGVQRRRRVGQRVRRGQLARKCRSRCPGLSAKPKSAGRC